MHACVGAFCLMISRIYRQNFSFISRLWKLSLTAAMGGVKGGEKTPTKAPPAAGAKDKKDKKKGMILSVFFLEFVKIHVEF